MQIKKVHNDFFVSVQISVEDLEAIKKHGIKTIICNRPDNEEDQQVGIQEITEAAKKLAMNVIYLPVVSGNIADDQVKEFTRLLAKVQKPVLAYCRTGTRSSILWSLSQAGVIEFDQVLAHTKNAGYELSHLQSKFEELS